MWCHFWWFWLVIKLQLHFDDKVLAISAHTHHPHLHFEMSYTLVGIVSKVWLMCNLFCLSHSELFTSCLDMLCLLLHSLYTDFHICLATGGEESKKACIKKLKSELSTAKSACLSEIQQLFPLSQKSYSVVTVKQPAFTQKGHSRGRQKDQGTDYSAQETWYVNILVYIYWQSNCSINTSYLTT